MQRGHVRALDFPTAVLGDWLLPEWPVHVLRVYRGIPLDLIALTARCIRYRPIHVRAVPLEGQAGNENRHGA